MAICSLMILIKSPLWYSPKGQENASGENGNRLRAQVEESNAKRARTNHRDSEPHVNDGVQSFCADHIDPSRFKIMLDAYSHLASMHQVQEKIHVMELLTIANSLISEQDNAFELVELEVILRKLQTENRLMYDETNRAAQRSKFIIRYSRVAALMPNR